MKTENIYIDYLTTICFLLLSTLYLKAQCDNSIQNPSTDVIASQFDNTVVVSNKQYAREYYVIKGLALKQIYIFASSHGGDYITVRDVYTNTVLGHGAAPYSYDVDTGPDLVEVHINLISPPCGTDAVPRITTATCSTCPSIPGGTGINTTNPQAALDVDGEIRLGNITRSPVEGMVRWNKTIKDFEGYNGEQWLSLTKGKANWGIADQSEANENVKVNSTRTTTNDLFGKSVAISGDYAIIGVNGDDDNGPSSGSAFVFVRSGTSWIEQAKLTPIDGATLDYFGSSVAISGDYAIIGAYGDDDNGDSSGSAYIFMRSGTTWSQQAKLLPSDGNIDDHFGTSVSISGDYVIVGADGDDLLEEGVGSAYIFIRSGAAWSQQAKLTSSDGSINDNFGNSVSISGADAIVGANFDDDSGSGSGSAYVFTRIGITWSQQAKLIASDGAYLDLFGSSVSISGDYALIGAYGDDDNGDSSGSAYVFDRSGTSWSQLVKLLPSDGNMDSRFGSSVSLWGDYALIGAYGDNDYGDYSGSAYIFKKSGTSWFEHAKLTASDGQENDNFGISVSIFGNYALIGAYGDDENGSYSGSAYIFVK